MKSRRSRLLLLSTFGVAAVSLACLALPVYVIQPFRPQGAAELEAALSVKQFGPWLAIACAALALGIVLACWERIGGWGSKSAAILALVLAAASAYLSQLNIYEFMFHPVGTPQFFSSEEAHLDKDDMVMAVLVNGEARAYPIREMGYHHVVNDVVGRVPIVATY